jgi:hypothetical protein
MIKRASPLLLAVFLAFALPAAAQDLLSGDSKSESTADVLQKLLLGKVKEKSATVSGSKAAPLATTTTSERLPRKAPGTGAAGQTPPDTAPAKPARAKPRPASQAEFRPLPRLQPTAPISASPTIQLPKPIPMPSSDTP